MSSAVVTTAATMKCQHGFGMTLTGATHLTVDGKGAVTAVAQTCTAPTSQTSKPCTALAIRPDHLTTTLTADGTAVLLATVSGAITDGLPAGKISVEGVQSKLTAS